MAKWMEDNPKKYEAYTQIEGCVLIYMVANTRRNYIYKC